MANFIQGAQLRTMVIGNQVIKPSQALPQSATANLYTVAGGAVLVTSLLGLVSGTAIGATVTTLALGNAPTTGTANTAGIATATAITSLEIGTWVGAVATAGKAGALVAGAHAGDSLFVPTPFVVPAGNITWTTSASDTGAMTWYLTYIPLDTGASVS